MTTTSLQARRAREAQGRAKRRGGGLGTIAVAAILATAAPGLIGLIWQTPQPSSATVVTGLGSGPVAPLLPAGADLGGVQDDAAAKPAAEPAPLRTAERALPMPPRSWTPVRRTVIVQASAAPTASSGDAIGPLDFPPSMSSRGASAGWFGTRTAALPSGAPAVATRLAPAEAVLDLPAAMGGGLAPAVPRATEPAPREVTATVICPGAAGCAVQRAPVPPAAGSRDITAALFPGGQLRLWATAQVAPASPQARDITRRLFPSGQVRW